MSISALFVAMGCLCCALMIINILVFSSQRLIAPPPGAANPRIAIYDRAAGSVGGFANRLLRRTTDLRGDIRLGRQTAVVFVALAVSPVAGFTAGSVLFGLSVRRRRRAANDRTAAIHESLAEVIDLYAVALHSGHNVTTATGEVARWVHGEVGEAFRASTARVAHGQLQSDALEEVIGVLGSGVRPLVNALVAHDRYGAPISQSLTQLAADTRADRRRVAEARARRLPVTLLFPLVVCVLPAFLLLTVVPVIAETFGSLNLS